MISRLLCFFVEPKSETVKRILLHGVTVVSVRNRYLLPIDIERCFCPNKHIRRGAEVGVAPAKRHSVWAGIISTQSRHILGTGRA
jgi:hypothetical protein